MPGGGRLAVGKKSLGDAESLPAMVLQLSNAGMQKEAARRKKENEERKQRANKVAIVKWTKTS